MTRMSRRAFLAASATAPLALAASGLAGCHSSAGLDPFVLPEAFDASRAHELTFWAKNDTNRTQARIYQAACDGFHAHYPNITVKVRLYTNYDDIYNDVITNIATRTTPNVCITYPDHIATYLSGQGVVVALDDLITHGKYGLAGRDVAFDGPSAGELIPKFLEECEVAGATYALPYMRSTEACYVNRTLVERLGYELPPVMTWDFIWEVSEAALARKADGTYAVNGQSVLIPFIYKSTDNMMIQLLAQADLPYSDAAGQILMFTDETQDILEEIAEHARSRAFSTFKISSYPANFLNAGQCLFAIDSTAGSTWMGSDAPLSDIADEAVVDFETAVLPIPQHDASDPRMISQGPSVCVFNKEDPQEVLASWLFAQYLLTDEVQLAYAKTEGYVPVTTRAQESAAYRDYLSRAGQDDAEHYAIKIAATRLLLERTNETFVTPVFNGSVSLRNAAGQLVEDTVKSARRGERTDDAFFRQLYRDVRQLYRLGQGGVAAGKQELGPLPMTAKALVAGLGVTWAAMGAHALRERLLRDAPTPG